MKKNNIKPAKKDYFKLMHMESSMINKNLFICIILIFSGLFFISHYFLKDKVDSKLDLMKINGKLYDYSFKENRSIRSHTYDYNIYLSEYRTRFQISADLVDWFNRAHFEQTVKTGDSLRILISQNDYKKIRSKENAIVFGIENHNGIYMEAENSIRAYNSSLTLYGGLVFIIAGILLIQKDKRKSKK